MVVCPNCLKKLNDNNIYCRICGTKLSGENPGDFTTEMLNVFDYGEELIYLFSDRGRQVILKAGSIEELELLVRANGYPWQFKDKSKNVKNDKEFVKAPDFSTDFLKASAVSKPEIRPTSSASKGDEGYTPEHVVERVVDENPNPFSSSKIDFSSVRPKRNPNRKPNVLDESEISREYGIYGVFRKDGKWAFRTNEVQFDIVEKTLQNLKSAVSKRGISWIVTDESLAERAFETDRRAIRENDERILEKRHEKEEFWKEKSEKAKELTRKRIDEVNGRLKNKNMDRMLR